jgi:peroxiredoxin family protein
MSSDGRKIAFICSKGNLDMAYPALIMGWAALGNGVEVTIFFTFWGLDMITEKRVDHLQLPPVGIAGIKLNLAGFPTGNLGIPQIIGALPGMTTITTGLFKRKIKRLEVPSIREYLQLLNDGGAKLYACKMTTDMFGLKKEDFLEGVEGIVTAGEFIDMTEGAQIIFI